MLILQLLCKTDNLKSVCMRLLKAKPRECAGNGINLQVLHQPLYRRVLLFTFYS